MGTFITLMSKRGLSLASVILAKTKNRAQKKQKQKQKPKKKPKNKTAHLKIPFIQCRQHKHSLT